MTKPTLTPEQDLLSPADDAPPAPPGEDHRATVRGILADLLKNLAEPDDEGQDTDTQIEAMTLEEFDQGPPKPPANDNSTEPTQ